jgi:hypothetical protein
MPNPKTLPRIAGAQDTGMSISFHDDIQGKHDFQGLELDDQFGEERSDLLGK